MARLTFEEALRVLDTRRHVRARRPLWHPDCWVEINRDGEVAHMAVGVKRPPLAADMTATDWEVVEDKPSYIEREIPVEDVLPGMEVWCGAVPPVLPNGKWIRVKGANGRYLQFVDGTGLQCTSPGDKVRVRIPAEAQEPRDPDPDNIDDVTWMVNRSCDLTPYKDLLAERSLSLRRVWVRAFLLALREWRAKRDA